MRTRRVHATTLRGLLALLVLAAGFVAGTGWPFQSRAGPGGVLAVGSATNIAPNSPDDVGRFVAGSTPPAGMVPMGPGGIVLCSGGVACGAE